MFELTSLEEFKYFYPDEIDGFSTKDIIKKVFFGNEKESSELLVQLESVDGVEAELLRTSLIELNLKLFHHYSEYIHRHSLLVDQLSREIEIEKFSAVKEKETLEKIEELSTIDEAMF